MLTLALILFVVVTAGSFAASLIPTRVPPVDGDLVEGNE
jgi:hypothetical protein